MAFSDTSAHGPARFGYRLLDAARWQPVLSEIWVRGASDSGTIEPPIAPTALSLRVAPNPALGGTIGVRLALEGSGTPDLALVDLNGRVVAHWTLGAITNGLWNASLPLNLEIRPGLYWLRATLPGRMTTARVAILR